MISVTELKTWMATLEDTSSVAIDDGGLTLVELNIFNEETGAYLEIGGLPLKEDEEIAP
jgi:hypothetical protein